MYDDDILMALEGMARSGAKVLIHFNNVNPCSCNPALHQLFLSSFSAWCDELHCVLGG